MTEYLKCHDCGQMYLARYVNNRQCTHCWRRETLRERERRLGRGGGG